MHLDEAIANKCQSAAAAVVRHGTNRQADGKLYQQSNGVRSGKRKQQAGKAKGKQTLTNLSGQAHVAEASRLRDSR